VSPSISLDFWALYANAIVAALLAAQCGHLGFFVVLRRLAFRLGGRGQFPGGRLGFTG